MTIRKNFLLEEEIAQNLEKIAKDAGVTQTQVVKNLIQDKYEEISVKEKLEAFEQIMQSVNHSGANKFLEQFEKDDTKILQKVKAMMEWSIYL